MKNTHPNFLVIGAGKSGTTSLYEYLNDHPEVYMSPVKETNYFALEGENINDNIGDPGQMRHYPWSITDSESYGNLFANVTTEKAIGEVSPMYLYSEKAVKNIKEQLPNVKLIVILRQPTDRLYSRYLHLARESRTPTDSFEDALNRQSIWWKRNDLVQEGFYFTHLSKYTSVFPKDQLLVILYDDLRKDPNGVIKSIYNFIGVDDTFMPNMEAEFNVSGIVANKGWDKIIGQNSIVKSWFSGLFPALMPLITKSKTLKTWVNQLRNKNLKRPPLSKDLKSKINEIYKQEIDQLQTLIGRDLSHWQTR